MLSFYVSIVIKHNLLLQVSLNAAKKLHNLLFNKVIKTSMQFFETTPQGRIQNLFSKDMDEGSTIGKVELYCKLFKSLLSFIF